MPVGEKQELEGNDIYSSQRKSRRRCSRLRYRRVKGAGVDLHFIPSFKTAWEGERERWRGSLHTLKKANFGVCSHFFSVSTQTTRNCVVGFLKKCLQHPFAPTLLRRTAQGWAPFVLYRNPDGDSGPWCYTTDPDKRWEYCDVPVCEWNSLALLLFTPKILLCEDYSFHFLLQRAI